MIDPGSFRDRTARVFYSGTTVCRGLTASAWEEWDLVSRSPFFQRAMDRGAIVQTAVADSAIVAGAGAADEWKGVLTHRRIPFISYPYEWCFGMLKDAALLHLELLAGAFEDGFILKDATPFNVQWDGTVPTFIDVTSFVTWRGEPWAGYRQFCQLFFYPLLLQAYKGVPFQPWLRGRLDGIEAEECRRLLSLRDMFRPGVLTQVVAQAKLQRRFGAAAGDVRREVKAAGFSKAIVAATITRLDRVVRRMQWEPGPSVWSGYATVNSYDEESSRTKEAFVDRVAQTHRGGTVWDLGCNTGRFSRVAAKYADSVVAVDSDHASIERLYRELKSERQTRILPLVGDVSDLSPALGWFGSERRAFVERGRPNLVLCLALIHHLAISANIPIVDLVRWLHGLGAQLVIEFPLPDDPMVQRLLLAREQAYDDYALEPFESALSSRFEIRERLALSNGTRVLYHAVPR